MVNIVQQAETAAETTAISPDYKGDDPPAELAREKAASVHLSPTVVEEKIN
jgi:hypothetical protein